MVMWIGTLKTGIEVVVEGNEEEEVEEEDGIDDDNNEGTDVDFAGLKRIFGVVVELEEVIGKSSEGGVEGSGEVEEGVDGELVTDFDLRVGEIGPSDSAFPSSAFDS